MRDTLNRIGNYFVPALLRSPLHFFASGSILLLSFTGRKSGKTYTTPVQYMQVGDKLTIFTQRSRQWWRNLQPAPVRIWLRGQQVEGTARAITATQDPQLMRERARAMYPYMSPTWTESLVEQSAMVEITLSTTKAAP